MLGVADGLVSNWKCGIRSLAAFNLYCWVKALDANQLIGADGNIPADEKKKTSADVEL